MTGAAILILIAVALLVWPRTDLLPRGHRAERGTNIPARLAALIAPSVGRRWIASAAAVSITAVALVAPWHAALCAGVLAALTTDSWLQARRRRLDEAQRVNDVDTLQALAAELRAGNDISAAFRSAGSMARTPMCRALGRAAQAVEMGDDPAASLERTGSAEVQPLAGLVRLSGSTGIALAEAIEVLADDATEAAVARREVASLVAGPRATAGMLTLLPVFGIVMGQMIGADPWRVLLHTSAGAITMITGTALAAAGVMWTATMVRRAEG